jgi:hypothetical protein
VFFDLPFWQQFLVLVLLFVPVDFLISFLLEVGPLASASPLSGGAGFAAVGVVELIVGIVGSLFGYRILWAPFGGFLLMIVVIVLIGSFIQGIQRAMARRLGLAD